MIETGLKALPVYRGQVRVETDQTYLIQFQDIASAVRWRTTFATEYVTAFVPGHGYVLKVKV